MKLDKFSEGIVN